MSELTPQFVFVEPPPLVRNFDVLATAPGGVARLRELFLALAVHGKLVPQDTNDEPASSLLRRIFAEKDQLALQGKIKRDKPLAVLTDDEEPFQQPKGWEWIRLGTIATIERGGSPRPIQDFLTEAPDGFNWIKIGDTEKGGKYITVAKEKIRAEGLSKTRMVYPGDFLLTNSMSFGRPYITQIEGCIHDGWLRISPPSSLNKDYLYTLLSSPFIRSLFEAAAAGGVVLNLNADKVRSIPIPLPPLREQARIVAHVEELMKLCDALEQNGRLADEQHVRLTSTLFDVLAASESVHALAENWQRVAKHFDLLLDRSDSVDALEQTILQLAIRGLLVAQDARDGSAAALIGEIESHKKRLVTQGKLKSDKPLADVEAAPFEVPPSWEWVRLGSIGEAFDYGTSQKSVDDPSAVPVLRMGNVQAGTVVMTGLKYLIDRQNDLPGLLLRPGDILFNRTNSYELVGKTGLYEGFRRDVTFASYLIRIRLPADLCSAQYVNMYMNSIDCRRHEIEPDLTQQTGQANYNGTKLRNIRVPLPPLGEQRRIVARVQELRDLCNGLRQRLTQAKEAQSRLADVVVAEVG
ncbi:MAG: restriction endonuclease subunit S [Rhizobacter sp.]